MRGDKLSPLICWILCQKSVMITVDDCKIRCFVYVDGSDVSDYNSIEDESVLYTIIRLE